MNESVISRSEVPSSRTVPSRPAPLVGDDTMMSMSPQAIAASVEELARLRQLSDHDLLHGIYAVVFDSRKLLAKLIGYLAEIERRRFWATLACSSLMDFCERRLRMSRDGAFRRKTAAQLALRFPVILGMLERGEIHMSALLQLREHLREDNHRELLAAASDKSKLEVEELLAARHPRPDIPSSIEPVTASSGELAASKGLTSTAPARERSIVEALSPGRYRAELTMSDSCRKKLERARDLMRHRNPSGDFGVILEAALDVFLPRLERERFGKTTRPRKPKPVSTGSPLPEATAQAAITPETKCHVWERDGKQCTFHDAEGNRCQERGFLELDHILPELLGGTNTADNLRLRCKPHNRLAAERTYGTDYIATRIRDSREKKKPVARAASNATTSEIRNVEMKLSAEEHKILEMVEGALVHCKFRKADAQRALSIVMGQRDPKTPLTFDTVFREALVVLTANLETRKH